MLDNHLSDINIYPNRSKTKPVPPSQRPCSYLYKMVESWINIKMEPRCLKGHRGSS